MKQKFSTLLGILLCAVIVLCGTACRKQSDDPSSTTPAGDPVNNGNSGSLEDDIYQNIPTGDYSGTVFHILNNTSNYGLTMMDTDTTGTAIEAAVFNRNLAVETNLGIEIVVEDMPYDQNKETISRLNGNTYVYDICYNESWAQSILVQQGAYYPLSRYAETLSLEKPWWYSDVIDAITICNNSYLVAGDMQMMWNDSVWCVAFNRTLLQNYGDWNLYEAVQDGDWTYEMMYEIIEQIHGDGDQGIYGVASHIGFASALLAGGGIQLVMLDEENGLRKTPVNTRFSDIYDQVLRFFTDNGVGEMNYIRTSYDSQSYIGGKFPSLDFQGIFTAGNAVFMGGTLGDMRTYLPSSEILYGVVPIPKAEAEQNQYINYVYEGGALCGIPSTVPEEKLEMIAVVMDNLAAYGHRLMRSAYYDEIIVQKVASGPECFEMLDIISGFTDDGYTYLELDNMFRIGMASIIQKTLSDASTAIRSELGSADDAINSKLAAIVSYYRDQGGS